MTSTLIDGSHIGDICSDAPKADAEKPKKAQTDFYNAYARFLRDTYPTEEQQRQVGTSIFLMRE